MGSKGIEQHPSSPQDILNYLNELFAYALSIGMTYDQYWKEDPILLLSYVKAEEIKQSKRNNELWLQGLYVQIAIGNLVPVLNPFSKEHKPRKYLERPIPITEKERQEYEQAKVNKMISKLDNLVGKKVKN